jgi:lipopolysaccharide transport system ATP-binding protein
MSEVAIHAEKLSKQYRIGSKQERYKTFRDALANSFRNLFSRSREDGSYTNEIWALNDISFDVHQGEVLGIVGRNGAGKSTLLKILSRITKPTSGRARVYGRVGSLLEVGTGFHPELTGRENIYLNGAIIGMKRFEIDQKFDEIVAFSEIEQFLDTPVKRYSSGMYVRLAFAVAAHLEPEILLVDEVLAVGDAAFQKKCLGKMGDVVQQGRTVLFVSHNMTAVRNLCSRVIWLQDGRIYQGGDTFQVTEAYLKQSLNAESLANVDALIRSLPPDLAFRMEKIIIKQAGQPCTLVLNGQPVDIEIQYTVLTRVSGLRVYFDILDNNQDILVRTFNDDDADFPSLVMPGKYKSVATIPANIFAPHMYTIRFFATIYNVRSCTPGGIGIPITVEASNGINRAYPQEPIRSKMQPKIKWVTVNDHITT